MYGGSQTELKLKYIESFVVFSVKMQSTPMLRSFSHDSAQKRDWKQRLSLRDNRRKDPVSGSFQFNIFVIHFHVKFIMKKLIN